MRHTCIIALMFTAACIIHAQTQWLKRATNTSAAHVVTSAIDGILVIGQPISGVVQSPNPFGWLGFLPLTGTGKPSEVEKDAKDQTGTSDILRLSVFPNPVCNELTVRTPQSTSIIDVSIIDNCGSRISLPFVLQHPNQTIVNVNTLPTGSYTILVYGINWAGWARIVILK